MSGEQNKVAVVTGALRGIGAAIARRLASDGFTVVTNFAGRAKDAEQLVSEVETSGGRAVTAQADVCDVAAVAPMFESAEVAFGEVDLLVNNAGIMTLASIATGEDALFDSHIAINESDQ